MASVTLKDVTKRWGNVLGVNDQSLEIDDLLAVLLQRLQ